MNVMLIHTETLSGLHLLEMAKTAWNASVSMQTRDAKVEEQAMRYLQSAKDILRILVSPDSEQSPLKEIETLESLLS